MLNVRSKTSVDPNVVLIPLRIEAADKINSTTVKRSHFYEVIGVAQILMHRRTIFAGISNSFRRYYRKMKSLLPTKL